MAKEKVNRKRCVQVKFRLTPEENAVLQKDVKDSGLTKNDYIIKTIINRVGLSVLSCEREYCGNSVDISFLLANKRIGYASCVFFKNVKKIQVSSFYVIKPFQDIGIEEKLLQEIEDFADMNQAESIIAYPGAEPYCPTEWKPIDTQTAWYKTNGFKMDKSEALQHMTLLEEMEELLGQYQELTQEMLLELEQTAPINESKK